VSAVSFFSKCVVLFFVLLQIWDAVPKLHAHIETPLSEFFNVKFLTYSLFLLLVMVN
jgi:hypothetical protein